MDESQNLESLARLHLIYGHIFAGLLALTEARQHFETGLAQVRALGSGLLILGATAGLASVAILQNDLAGAQALLAPLLPSEYPEGQEPFPLWFPKLPERTRLFRRFKAHRAWTDRFLAEPTVLGVVDSYGVELLHPRREGRSDKQIGKKGYSNRRWIVGSKVCCLLNQKGLVCGWACATANVHDALFHPLIQSFEDHMIVLADHGFHSKQGNPKNLKVCQSKTWNVRMIVETMLSMLTTVCLFKRVAHRTWEYFNARLAFTMAVFNLLVQWHGLQPDPRGFIHLSIAEFSL
ncbi:MAG TPA: transposase [Anaerolineales bacterium]